MNASELFFNVRAKGGDVIMGMDGEIEKFAGSPELVRAIYQELGHSVSYENLRAVVQEHSSAVSVAEKFLASIKRPAENPKKPKAKKPETMVGLERRLLAALESYAGKRGYCTPTLAMLTADLGLQPDEWQKVRGALGELEAKSFISIEKRPNTSNRYTILASTPVDGPALACKPPKVRSES
jgi:hypothetical protein